MKRKLAIGVGAAVAITAFGGAPAIGDGARVDRLGPARSTRCAGSNVSIDGEEAVGDFEPGTLTDPVMLAPGSYDIQVFADGGHAPTPRRRAPSRRWTSAVPEAANLTLRRAPHGRAGDPTLSAFGQRQPTRSPPARPASRCATSRQRSGVDVRAGGTAIVEALTNPNEASLDHRRRRLGPTSCSRAPTPSRSARPTSTSPRAANTIVTAWGMRRGRQPRPRRAGRVEAAHGAPSGVPSGIGGIADAACARRSRWLIAGALGLALIATRVLRPARERS